MIIRDIATLRRYVRISYTQATEKNLPDISYAEREYLMPILGMQLYSALDASITTPPAANPAVWSQLLDYCRAAVAPLAVWLELPFLQAQLEDGGLKTTRSEYKDAAHQWEYLQIQNALLDKGMKALEFILEFLPTQKNVFNWSYPGERTLIRTGKELSLFVGIDQPNLTFELMRPILLEVEDHFIKNSIGEPFFDYLNSLDTYQSPSDKKAAQLTKKAVAHYSIARALERLPVRITRAGVLATLQNSNNDTQANPTAKETQIDTLKTSSESLGNSYLLQLLDYLNAQANAQTFTLFFESEFFKGVQQRSYAQDVNNNLAGFVAF